MHRSRAARAPNSSDETLALDADADAQSTTGVTGAAAGAYAAHSAKHYQHSHQHNYQHQRQPQPQPQQQQRSKLLAIAPSLIAVLSVLLLAALVAVGVLASQLQSARSAAPSSNPGSSSPPPPPPPNNAGPPGRIASGPSTPGGVLWPLPASLSFDSSGNSSSLRVSSALSVVVQGTVTSARLTRAAAIFTSDRFFSTGCKDPATARPQGPLLSRVVVKLASGDEVPLSAASEAYTLSVPANGSDATITADSPIGAIRALETLAQLITPITKVPPIFMRSNGCANSSVPVVPGFVIRNAPWVISDAPRFPHRGILLDTSRHFMPISVMLRIIDAMAITKLNVLHWHAVDSHSFPIESTAVPNITAMGAYSPWQIYTKKNVQDIIAYAGDRGIRIIPEFDVPGHTYSWGLGIPNLVVCPNKKPWQNYCAEPPCGQLDITRNDTYSVLDALFREQTAAFPDTNFHLGSDEINQSCYLEDPGVSAYLRANSLSLDQLLQTFNNRVLAMLQRANKSAIYWEEIALEHTVTLPNNTIIQAWKGAASVISIAQKGFRVVASPASHWYLDCGRGNFVNAGGGWCDPFKTWQTMYHYDPTTGLTDDQKLLVHGGEVNMWTEVVDGENVESVIFPRAAAVGEVLWSTAVASSRDWGEAEQRLDNVRAIMSARGINASPLRPQFCVNDNCI